MKMRSWQELRSESLSQGSPAGHKIIADRANRLPIANGGSQGRPRRVFRERRYDCHYETRSSDGGLTFLGGKALWKIAFGNLPQPCPRPLCEAQSFVLWEGQNEPPRRLRLRAARFERG
jgi:hypothetical protein